MSTVNFTSQLGSLRDAVTRAAQATPSNPAMVAYSGVLFEVEADRISIIGSDGETTIMASLDAVVESPGRFLLPPKPILSLLSKLPANLTVSVKMGAEGEIVLEAGTRAPYRFRPLSATFPAPTLPTGEARPVNFERLAAVLNAVRHAVGKDSPAVQLVSDDNKIVFNATDSYRLARAEMSEGGFGPFTGVVPLQVLEKVSRSGVTAVSTDARSRLISFHTPGATVTTRLLATTFPAVDGVISGRPDASVRFETQPVVEALGRLSSVADEAPLKVRIDRSTIELSVSNVDLGSGLEEDPLASPTTTSIEFFVKLPYLLDALARFDSVELSYSGATLPIFVCSVSPVTSTQVVMPIRL